MSSLHSQVQAPVPVHEARGGPSVSSHEGTGGPSMSSRTGTSSPPKVQPLMSSPQSQVQAPVPAHEASGGPSVSSHEGTGGPSVSSPTGTSSPSVSCRDGSGSPSVSGMSTDLSGIFEMSASESPGNMPLTSTPIASDFSHVSSFESESTILSVKIDDVTTCLPKLCLQTNKICVCASDIDYVEYDSQLYLSCKGLFFCGWTCIQIEDWWLQKFIDALLTNKKLCSKDTSCLFIFVNGERWMRQDAVLVFLTDSNVYPTRATQKQQSIGK